MEVATYIIGITAEKNWEKSISHSSKARVLLIKKDTLENLSEIEESDCEFESNHVFHANRLQHLRCLAKHWETHKQALTNSKRKVASPKERADCPFYCGRVTLAVPTTWLH